MNHKSFLSFQNVIKTNKFNKPSIVSVKFCKKSLKILSVLLKEGFIRGYFLDTYNTKRKICILLKYVDDNNLLDLKSINLKEQRTYLSTKSLKKRLIGSNTLVLSTKKGFTVYKESSNLKIGGFPVLNIA